MKYEKVERFINEYLSSYKPYKGRWCYEDGCVLKGSWDLYRVTGNQRYLDFVSSYFENFIDEQGNVKGYNLENYALDDICPASVLIDFYEIEKKEKYRKALDLFYKQIISHPRTKIGNFWHKKIYPNQIWLDGLYMVMPFYTKYAKKFLNFEEALKDIVNQFLNVRKYMWDEKKKLYYHGYDESRVQEWADKITGLSKSFWARAQGWFMMALVDVLDAITDIDKSQYFNSLADIFVEAAYGLINYQDEETGMWYQVIDQVRPDNYLETSATLMFAYSFLKGFRLGLLGSEFKDRGLKAFDGTVKKYLVEKDGKLSLHGICSVAGLGWYENRYRDGSYKYYLSEKVVSDDPKGVGPLMMAYSELLNIS
ncbi:glycoside hydrolase family 88/105 protein [Pseudothermotoga thermarum]|uniref:Glycosyl hydrolase family 88 n=1 Tax=Pseudothermotoga thermarum DSM 5069 TaxID=688269 RepID=F7YW07_9THEM|nr:glycoside hydrolase family 88 protein [Pseudothermotoga thermarum]AEH50494.1 glycosyl hydrolase family 88 [Pseudothermotoga thermarum DSM 5069]